jgi:uncharacterized membrane protein YkoI
MKRIKSTVWFLVIASGLGIAILCLPPTANAQSDKNQTTNKQDDDDAKETLEKLSRKDKKRIKVTMEAARATALNRVSGTITEEDLEKENGRLQYAFDIRDGNGKIWDVEVDAISGEILKADDGSDDEDDDVGAEKLSPADAKQVKISMEAARAIALKRVSGTIVEEELEKEKGRLQYSFDIRDGNGKIWDVEVDAKTGKILKATDKDDEDGDGEQSNVEKAKKSVQHAAIAVKNATVKTVGKLF